MWPKKLLITQSVGSDDCETCGWYGWKRVTVTDEKGNELMSEYGDGHLSGGEINSTYYAAPLVLEKAGYGADWSIDQDFDNDKADAYRLIDKEEKEHSRYVFEYDSPAELYVEVLKSFGHEVEFKIVDEDDYVE